MIGSAAERIQSSRFVICGSLPSLWGIVPEREKKERLPSNVGGVSPKNETFPREQRGNKEKIPDISDAIKKKNVDFC